MKQILSLWAIVAIVFFFSGCQKESSKSTEEPVEKPVTEQTTQATLSFTSVKPGPTNTTRTMYQDGATVWNADGEKIKMTYKVDNQWVNELQRGTAVALYPSEEAEVSADGTTATFEVTGDFPSDASEELQFYAVYPASATTGTTVPDAPELTVTVPVVQTPTTETYDATADLLVAKSTHSYTELPTESVGLVYTRLVAHNTITLKGLPFLSGETVTNVTFTAPADRQIVGHTDIDFETQTATPAADAVNTITLNYNNISLNTDGNLPVWFCSLPFTIAGGEIFTVQVTTSRGIYTRAVSAPADWDFAQHCYNTLAINMGTADFTAPTVEGEYVVLALENGVYYALSSATSGKGLGCEDFDYDGNDTTVTNDDATLAWTIVDAGDGTYTMQNDGLYLTGENGNKASTGTTPYPLTITENGDGSYTIASVQDPTLLLSSDIDKDCFAFYTANRNAELYLIPIAEN